LSKILELRRGKRGNCLVNLDTLSSRVSDWDLEISGKEKMNRKSLMMSKWSKWKRSCSNLIAYQWLPCSLDSSMKGRERPCCFLATLISRSINSFNILLSVSITTTSAFTKEWLFLPSSVPLDMLGILFCVLKSYLHYQT
jgi:hypothetical protein